MPRYYFHVRRGQFTLLDHEGIELADNVDAELEAARRARRLLNGGSLTGSPPQLQAQRISPSHASAALI
jgi:hypothetical protein